MGDEAGPDLSVVIPAFDEAQRLPPTLKDLKSYLQGQPLSFEVVLGDDGSRDETRQVFAAQTVGIRARAVGTASNLGKGSAVRLGMRAARGAVQVMCDADGSMPARELPKLIEPVRQGRADVAIGSRYLDGRGARGQKASRRIWSRFAHSVVKQTLVPGIMDTHCGYKAFSAAAAAAIFSRASIDGWAFDLEVLALAQRLGLRIVEIPVEWSDAPCSRVRGGLHDLLAVVEETLQIRSNFKSGFYDLGAGKS